MRWFVGPLPWLRCLAGWLRWRGRAARRAAGFLNLPRLNGEHAEANAAAGHDDVAGSPIRYRGDEDRRVGRLVVLEHEQEAERHCVVSTSRTRKDDPREPSFSICGGRQLGEREPRSSVGCGALVARLPPRYGHYRRCRPNGLPPFGGTCNSERVRRCTRRALSPYGGSRSRDHARRPQGAHDRALSPEGRPWLVSAPLAKDAVRKGRRPRVGPPSAMRRRVGRSLSPIPVGLRLTRRRVAPDAEAVCGRTDRAAVPHSSETTYLLAIRLARGVRLGARPSAATPPARRSTGY